MKGKFLVFEGIDGSGKRTLCNYSKKILEDLWYQVKKYEYPDYKSPWGKIITDFLSGSRELDVSVQFLTYAADIVKDQEEIKEYLESYFIVADRYITSTVAFQCARGFDLEKALQFVHLFEIIPPDVIFYMNVSPEIGKARKKGQKGGLDRHEADMEFLEKVNSMYRELRDRKFLAKKWIEVNANQGLSKVKDKIRSETERIL